MPLQQPISDEAACQLAIQLGSGHPAIPVLHPEMLKGTVLPEKLFQPDLCFKRDKDYFLVHALVTPEIPTWIKEGRQKIRHKKHIQIVLVGVHTKEWSGPKIGSQVAEEARRLGFGLAVQTNSGTHLVFPPNFQKPIPTESKDEAGHIPSWLYQRASEGSSFSPYLRKHLRDFIYKYEEAKKTGTFDYSKECRLLTEFAEDVTEGDPRIYCPLDRLQVLKAYERGGSNQSARDHFFHTFNNFFLGLVVLDVLCSGRNHTTFPDSLIGDNHRLSQLHLWESLWFITAIFHDPGYIPQDIWSLIAFGYGLENDPSAGRSIPQEMIQHIENVWDTNFLRPRKEIQSICEVVMCHSHTQKNQNLRQFRQKFDSAIRLAYFDGHKPGHSLISGLALVNQCLNDRTARHRHFHKVTALNACKIAALSILFHDQHCRDVLVQAGIHPIPFITLPYASVLMFVDALQDDRRDVTRTDFPKMGVLGSLRIEGTNGIVTAGVRLRNVPLNKWPSRIAEHENIMHWINPNSPVKFIVDYRSDLGL